jgi:hypothetical protein
MSTRKAKCVLVFIGTKSDWTGPRPALFTPHVVASRSLPRLCEPCLSSPAEKPPAGAGWLHEIKHDGFRMLVRGNAAGVRLFTRNGHDWTGRFPLIARAALSLKAASCLIDGEAVACDNEACQCSTGCAGCVELFDDHHTLPPLLFVVPTSFGGGPGEC